MSTDQSSIDLQHMNAALALAARGLGKVHPNPAVGCVLVKDGAVIGRGFTQPGGRPHAEVVALNQAGAKARGATAYVTLEPCSHYGKTPPCADALINAGIARCVVATEDPDSRVQGSGIKRLREAGIEVSVGLCRLEAEEVNAGFFMRVNHGRPLVTLKVATTMDGRIATKTGQSRWITGPEARQAGQMLRVTHDAILVGSGTAVMDNPRLDVRIPGLEAFSPVRVVMDGRLRLPLTHDLVSRAWDCQTILMTFKDNEPHRLHAYQEAGVDVVHLPKDELGYISASAMLRELGERGVTRLLVEGGSHIIGSLLRADLIDRIVWFRASKVIGGDGIAAAAGFGLENLAEAPRYSPMGIRRLGEDLMETYRREL